MDKYSELYQEDFVIKAEFQEVYSHVTALIDVLEEKEKKISADHMKVAELDVDVRNLIESLETLETKYQHMQELEELNKNHKMLVSKNKCETMMATSVIKLQENLTVQLNKLKLEFEESHEGQELVTLRAELSHADTDISALMQEISEKESIIKEYQNENQKYCHEIEKLEQEVCEKEKMSNSLAQEINFTEDTLVTLQKECEEKLLNMTTWKGKQSDIHGTSSQSKNNFSSLLNFSKGIKISNKPKIDMKDDLFPRFIFKPMEAKVDKKRKRKLYPEVKKSDNATKENSQKAILKPKKQKNSSTQQTVQQEPLHEMHTDKKEVNVDYMYSTLMSPVHVPLSQEQNLDKVEEKKTSSRPHLNFTAFPELIKFKKDETKKMKCSQKFSQEAETSYQEKKDVSQIAAKSAVKEKMKVTEEQEVQEKLNPPGKPKPETKAQVKMKFLEKEESRKFPETKRIQVLENIVMKPGLKPSVKPPPSPSESSARDPSELNFDIDMGDMGDLEDYGTDVGSGDFNIESDNGEFNFIAPSDNAAKDSFGW